MQGAEEMGNNEHLLNVYVSKHAADSCAAFLGYTVVDNAREVQDRRITPGKWLLWRFQGLKTLAQYIRRKDCITALAADLQIAEDYVIHTVLKQVLDSIAVRPFLLLETWCLAGNLILPVT